VRPFSEGIVPRVVFTSNLLRHVDCPPRDVEGGTVRAVLDAALAGNPRLRGYLLDEQDRLRRHIAVFVDGRLIRDGSGRDTLDEAVEPESEIYVMQALSGG
jgi:hypothetical protein